MSVTAEWVAGDFIGEYVGRAVSSWLPSSTRSYRIEIVRGIVTQPQVSAGPPASAESAPLMQPALSACYFKLPSSTTLQHCPIGELELHDWRQVEAEEHEDRVYGRIVGKLYGRIGEPQPEPKAPPEVASILSTDSQLVTGVGGTQASVFSDVGAVKAPLKPSKDDVARDKSPAEAVARRARTGCGTWLALLGVLFLVGPLLPVAISALALGLLAGGLVVVAIIGLLFGKSEVRIWAFFALLTLIMLDIAKQMSGH